MGAWSRSVLAVSRRLVPLADSAWSFSSGEGAPASYLVLPDGQVDLLFAVRSGRPSLMVVGTHERAVRKRTEGIELSLSIRLRPGAAAALFEVPAAALTGRAILLEELWGDDARRLLEELSREQPVDARAERLQTAIEHQARRRAAPASTRTVREAMRRIAGRDEPWRVAALASELGVCERQFRRAFVAAVGLTPRAFARVVRLQRAVAVLEAAPRLSWASIAANAGYFDQSHLVSDFKELLGLTPRALRQELSAAPLRAPTGHWVPPP